jgi:hypothetical protein
MVCRVVLYGWSSQFTRKEFDDILDVETGGMLEVVVPSIYRSVWTKWITFMSAFWPLMVHSYDSVYNAVHAILP